MPKTKEELLAMSQEDLAEYALTQTTQAKEAFAKRDELKNEVKTLKTSNTQLNNQFEEVNTKLNDYTQANTKTELAKKLVEFNIQEKFLDDVISKSGLTLDLEEDKLKEQVAKTLETYPEYKSKPSTVNVDVKTEEKFNANQAYLEAVKGKKIK